MFENLEEFQEGPRCIVIHSQKAFEDRLRIVSRTSKWLQSVAINGQEAFEGGLRICLRTSKTVEKAPYA